MKSQGYSVVLWDPFNPPLLLLRVCATAAFISMWVQNTAAAVMMPPVATGIIQHLPKEGNVEVHQFFKALILGVIYSAPIGTGAILILAEMWSGSFPGEIPISFSTWFFFGFLLAMIIFFALWGVLCLLYLSKGSRRELSAYLDKGCLKRELELLGPIDFAENMILTVFTSPVILWMTRSLTEELP